MWWIPVLVALGAVLASYSATWRFKRADVNRENAFRAADLVDQAEQLTSRSELYADAPEGGARTVLHLMQAARIRAQPLDDDDLQDRLVAALNFVVDMQLCREEPGRARHWITEATANIRSALVPHLAAPRFFGRARPVERSFPTTDELNAMNNGDDDGNQLIDALVQWRAEQSTPRSRLRGLRRG